MSSPGVPLRVLVVEDDELVRTFIRFALQRDGMTVLEAATGTAALARAAAEDVDVVLVDGLLPDMHGIGLAQQLLDNPATAALPICFLSGAVQGRLRAGAGFGCLSKPVPPAQLTKQVRELAAWDAGGDVSLEERREALQRLQGGFLVGP